MQKTVFAIFNAEIYTLYGDDLTDILDTFVSYDELCDHCYTHNLKLIHVKGI